MTNKLLAAGFAALALGIFTSVGCTGSAGDPITDVTPGTGAPAADPSQTTGTQPPASTPPTTMTTAPPSTTTTPPSTTTTTPPPDTTAPPPASAGTGTIVPLYTPPQDPSWSAIVAAKQAHPRVKVIAIVNPANGPGPSLDAAYAAGIDRLTKAGITVVGYVFTSYAARPEAAVKADMDQWKAFYPQLTGVFFDEQSNRPGNEDYYRRLSQHAKQAGLAFTIGNPGTDTAESYVGALDTMLIYESRGISSVSALGGWHAKYEAANFGVIPYGTGLNLDYVRMARTHVGYIYLNNDDLPNPWDSLPPYFGDLLAALE